MKKSIITSILAALAVIGSTIMAQDYPDEYLGLPGDNLNLYAVMNLFQNSETLEGFERNLNDENSRINNLDLNSDNLIDYIRVNDYVNGNVHTIVLQAVLGRSDVQDVAVFTVERLRDGSVQIQLVGDELLYGRNYIIEPIYAETPNPGYTGGATRDNVTVVRTTYVEVATWPVIRFIFLPHYSVWRSSWYWGYYPRYWNPWRPYYWHYYYGYHYHWHPHYYSHYHRWDHHRYSHWNDVYYNRLRSHSHSVSSRISSGSYRTTYSRPELRREGEALYSRVHPDRPSNVSSGNNVSRRSSAGSAEGRNSAGTTTTTTRRSSTTVQRSDANDRGTNTTGTSRRSSSTTVNREVNRSSSGQGNSDTRRSGTTVNTRSNSGSSSGNTTGTTRRSTNVNNDRKPLSSSSGNYSSTARRSTSVATERTTARTSSSGSFPASSRRSSDAVTERKPTYSSSGNASASSRRQAPVVSERSQNRSQSASGSASTRQSREQVSSSGSSARRSSGSSRNETVIRQGSSSNNRESDSKGTSRRK